VRDTVDNKADQHDTVATRAIQKLVLDPRLVGQRRVETKAELVHDFQEEWNSFNVWTGNFAYQDMWVVSANPTQFTYH
jgi:hypothetical protein